MKLTILIRSAVLQQATLCQPHPALVCFGVKTSVPEGIGVLQATFNIRKTCNYAINWNKKNNCEKGHCSNATEQIQCKPACWYVYTTIYNNIKIKMSSVV